MLQTSQSWTHNYDQTQHAGYWECVCNAENAYFNEELPQEEFAHQMESCNQQYYGYNYKRAEVNNTENIAYAINPTVDLSQIMLYPQPAGNELTLELTIPYDGEVMFSVSDLSGKVVSEGIWHWTGTSQGMDVSNFTTGVYLVSLQFGDQAVKTLKFVKE